MSSQSTDLVVVGAGLAGLVAAAHAAEAGLSVTLVERSANDGGRARTRSKDGFSLNQGAHALYGGGAGSEALAAVGVVPDSWSPPLAGLVRSKGRFTQLPTAPVAVLRTKALKTRSKIEFGKWMSAIPKFNPAEYAEVTTTDFINSNVSNDDTVAIAKMFVRLTSYCDNTDVMSADGFIAMTQMAFTNGVQYLHGGWGAMVKALRAAGATRGVTYLSGEAVDAVTDTPGGFTVSFGENKLQASQVLLAAGSPQIAANIAGDLAPSLKTFANHAVPVTAACLDLCLNKSPAERFALSTDAPLYWSEHAPAAGLAPKGSSLVHALRYGATNAKADRAELEQWASQLDPTWRDRLVHSQFLANIHVASDLPKAANGGLGGRAPVSVRDCEGLLLAGDWVGQEGLLAEASLASGAKAAAAAAASKTGN